jgi:hypothetical protein
MAGAGGGLGPGDEAARGPHLLAPGDASDGRPLREQDPTQHRAEGGDSLSARKGRRVGRRGCLDEAQRDSAAPRRLGVNQGEVDGAPLLHGGLRAPLRHPVPVRLGGQRRPARGQGSRPVGRRHVGQECSALTWEREAAPEPGAGGPPLGGRGVGLREPPATPPPSDCRGVARVVCGLAAVDRVHRPRVAEAKGPRCLGAAVGEPGPGQDAVDRDDQRRPIGGHGLAPRRRPGVPGAMPQALAVLAIENDGAGDLIIIETQLGVCLEEDITRLEDDWGRV